jgi:integrase
MYTSTLTWIDHYETHILRRKLKPDEYIFPAFNSTWTALRPNEPCDSKAINSLINEMAAAAGIKGARTFTTHCFRRGGAQYRFMYAPIGERWSLARVRWWGGWAEGEHVRISISLALQLLLTLFSVIH